jgi:hypothetical protein
MMIASKAGYLSVLQRIHELVRFDAITRMIAGHLVRLPRCIGRAHANRSTWSMGLILTRT